MCGGAAAIGVAVLVALTTSSAFAAGSPKASLCDVPPGNPSNVHPISVSANAVGAQVAHGDFYNLDGNWAGPFSQPPFAPYPFVVSFQGTCSPVGSVVASVNYPTFFDCAGSWTLESAAGTAYVVREQIGAGCISGCPYRLTYDPVADQIHVQGIAGTCPFSPETWSGLLSRTP